MKTQSIQQIEEQIAQVEKALESFVPDQHQEERYGPEREYTPEFLKGGIKAILTDLRGLVKAHDKFIQLSTHSERETIHSYLGNIVNLLIGNNYSDVFDHSEHIKTILRNYSIRSSSETQNVLEERVNRLDAQCSIVEENINTTKRIKEESEQARQKIQSAEEKIESLNNIITELQGKTDQATILQDQSQQNHQIIEKFLTSAKSHEEIIKSFVQRVEKREQQLDGQEQSTTAYQEKLTSFEDEHKEKLDAAEKLINQARNALGYRTAQGISAAFNERYLEEKTKGKVSLWWLACAALFVSSGIGIGIWLVVGTQAIGFGLVVSRITIMSLALSAAWFCAAQYVRHRNTLEDYSYKAVLSKSIVAFLDQLTGEERERYLEMVLFEIHQDPLRKKHDIDTPASKFIGMFGGKEKSKQPETQTKGLAS